VDLGESVVRLTVQGDGTLTATDFFTPTNASALDNGDIDLGSGGPVGLPEGTGAFPTTPRILVQVGKEGVIDLLDRDSLGGVGNGSPETNNNAVIAQLGPFGGVWSRPAVWPGDGGWVYIPSVPGPLNFFQYGVTAGGTGIPTLTLAAQTADNFGFGSSPRW
jgi:hypothetical protein